MTDKQEKILEAALKLFASEGYAATPTSKIAKEAGVSEGLIFRHFTSKRVLLDALMSMAETKLAKIYGPVFMETDPKEVLHKSLHIFDFIDDKDFNFWKLQYMLKWQKEYNHPEKMKPVLDKLTEVFEALGYDQPEMEALYLNIILESVFMNVLKENISKEEANNLLDFIRKKYMV